MSQLAIFDIDGTLTDTNGADDECYRAAVADALAVPAWEFEVAIAGALRPWALGERLELPVHEVHARLHAALEHTAPGHPWTALLARRA